MSQIRPYYAENVLLPTVGQGSFGSKIWEYTAYVGLVAVASVGVLAIATGGAILVPVGTFISTVVVPTAGIATTVGVGLRVAIPSVLNVARVATIAAVKTGLK